MSQRSNPGTTNWEQKTYPDFKGLKAYILPGAFYSGVVRYFAEAGFSKASSVEDCDVVVFIGGADISPSLYGDMNVASCGINFDRDQLETEIYQKAVKLGKVVFGICRGAQLIQACNGGKLWQDVDGHCAEHWIVDIETDHRVKATSVHHQMLMTNDKLSVIAVTEHEVSKVFRADGLTVNNRGEGSNGTPVLEIEAGCYETTKSFFVQGHPEIGGIEYRTWCMHKFFDLYEEWSGGLIPISQVLENKEIK